MELVSEAIAFAAKAHDGMRRKKSDAPYILHPMEASVIVGTMTDDQNLIAAAALHDVVEDTDITIEEIEEKFGKRVRDHSPFLSEKSPFKNLHDTDPRSQWLSGPSLQLLSPHLTKPHPHQPTCWPLNVT